MNRRKRSLLLTIIIITMIIGVLAYGVTINQQHLKADFLKKNEPPTLKHPFGTDWMGRDMFFRTLKGLSISIIIGLVASFMSAMIAVFIGALAGIGPKWLDQCILWLIDLMMGIPHMILLILISFVLGRGIRGILIGISITHWTSLARLIRGEVLQIRNEIYIQVSKKLGKGNFYLLRKHIFPHILPQILVGLIWMFPHAILHEASITFLGFGLSPEQPAVGIILSESMKYLSVGMWWLAVFPGACLIFIVMLFDILGENLKRFLDPNTAQE
ncbi:ABC transporter permease [Garciella nitratireducens]|uniref:Peptide/nickel transport system permease protein n=1 Tax=Garciella nitratireducens DSM 15102 TaxID=1121911 RepID=A0A1T4LWX0_9FIRM|nr:peptide/nickel transport system permease protein [Garciella nitratireducens]SJZ58944.1 peptide/nickel transport system permease protein [Garciella nitratireducens DSM 15102]